MSEAPVIRTMFKRNIFILLLFYYTFTPERFLSLHINLPIELISQHSRDRNDSTNATFD